MTNAEFSRSRSVRLRVAMAYLLGVGCIGVGLWWVHPSAALVTIGAIILYGLSEATKK